MTAVRPVSLTLAALGGQGGGVVSSWLTDVARREGYLVQATSVPGVAQRTGATIYYFEFFAEVALPPDGRRPVMALMPSPGDVDIVVASELVEAGRVIQRGLVTPGRTTLIASTHRAYTISEKSHTGDGRASSERILEEAVRQSKRFVALDMAAIAEQQGAVISSVILGAIAGASGLPFARESYREAIRAGGIAVERNLAGFDAGALASAAPVVGAVDVVSPEASALLPSAVGARIAAELPSQVQPIVTTAAARLIDYQDEAHAVSYLDALRRFCAIDAGHPGEGARLTRAVAKGLALWMSFEDTIRVADLKTRADRQRRVRASAHAKPGQLVRVTEFMKPRVEEICGTLPAGLGRRILGSPTAVRWLGSLTDGREIHTSTISGYALLRMIGGLRRWRRGTLRFREEVGRAERWLDQVARHAERDYALAVELADCQKLVRGYGDTYERGLRNFERLCQASERLVGRPDAAAELSRLRALALADDSGQKLAVALAS
jgi:indolepyruvate ferredoxin oxidoreductase beta subunit